MVLLNIFLHVLGIFCLGQKTSRLNLSPPFFNAVVQVIGQINGGKCFEIVFLVSFFFPHKNLTFTNATDRYRSQKAHYFHELSRGV